MPWRRAVLFGLIAALAAFSWQFLTVHYNYGGNWTALFCIAPHMPVPLFLKSERLYIFQNSNGSDGMVFHLTAHDPWVRHGSAEAIGGTAYRYRRILVPALAWCLAIGHDAWVHTAYYTVILASVFWGMYWLSLLLARDGRHPAWGMLFALTPATLTSIDRMTVDIAVAALDHFLILYRPVSYAL
jgi:hypothetical protein